MGDRASESETLPPRSVSVRYQNPSLRYVSLQCCGVVGGLVMFDGYQKSSRRRSW